MKHFVAMCFAIVAGVLALPSVALAESPNPPGCRHLSNIPTRGAVLGTGRIDFRNASGGRGHVDVRVQVLAAVDMCEGGNANFPDTRSCDFKGDVTLVTTSTMVLPSGSTREDTDRVVLGQYLERTGINCNATIDNRLWHGAHDRAVARFSPGASRVSSILSAKRRELRDDFGFNVD